MDSRWLGVIVLIIILAAGGWYIFSHPVSPTPATTDTPPVTDQTTTSPVTDQTTQTTTTTSTTTTTDMPLAPVIVTYTSKGFSPKTVTVSQGQMVTFVNKSSGNMWVASAAHPTHTVYDGTNKDTHCAAGYTGPTPFDECVAISSGSYSFTFTKVGTFGYHNHASASMTGTVVVATAPAAGTSATTTVKVKVNVQ